MYKDISLDLLVMKVGYIFHIPAESDAWFVWPVLDSTEDATMIDHQSNIFGKAI